MATPCRKIGCAALVHSRYKGGYCEAHQSERAGWKRSKRSQRAGLTGRPWRRLRAEVMHRDGHVCQTCHRQGKLTPATEVDHIVNLASGFLCCKINFNVLGLAVHLFADILSALNVNNVNNMSIQIDAYNPYQ